MINFSGKKMWITGLALIVITNAVVLLGAAWNRSGSPESQLELTQRELRLPYWRMNRESSGASLNLLWRTLPAEAEEMGYSDYSGYAGNGGAPYWLDRAKLQSLGFDMAGLTTRVEGDARRERPLSRSALLVLELNGPACQESLARARRHAADAEAKAAATPENDDLKRRAESARKSEAQAKNESPRLFVIDAGMELSELRAKYPDRTRYAIVHGQVRPRVFESKDGVKVEGFIDEISNSSVNIPYDHRATFKRENGKQSLNGAMPSDVIAVTIAFGKRLEPWVVALSGSKAAGAGK